jgi:hypothetical protein
VFDEAPEGKMEPYASRRDADSKQQAPDGQAFQI